MMNWLSADEDLISIRPKEPADQAVNVQKLGQSIQRISSPASCFCRCL
jgi:hypothetical protein